MQEGTSIYGGSLDAHTSRVHSLSIAVVNVINPAATLDLSNNEMIIEYDGTSPLAGTLSTGLERWIAYAHAGGGWDQPGVKSSFCNEGAFGIGYGEATDVLNITQTGTGTFENQLVDGTSVLLKTTRYGDANLDGYVTFTDSARMFANWKEAGLWPQGDFDYSGDVNEGDFRTTTAAIRSGGPARCPRWPSCTSRRWSTRTCIGTSASSRRSGIGSPSSRR